MSLRLANQIQFKPHPFFKQTVVMEVNQDTRTKMSDVLKPFTSVLLGNTACLKKSFLC